ncbi:transposase family protein [Streptomyces nigrescens]|uniref:transposase family protein n=1 Tax=Streptomyces nigrescens TaxID=1920 RepID=UPI003485AD83
MLLAFLAKGDTFEQLGCHFGIGTETARRYVNEGIDALAAPAPSLSDALAASGEERRLLLDGALMSAWRCISPATEANPDPLYQAKHREHGMNVQALTTTEGELVFLGKARAGSTHDLTAARADGIIESAAEQGADITADSGHQGVDGPPDGSPPCRTRSSPSTSNSAHSQGRR